MGAATAALPRCFSQLSCFRSRPRLAKTTESSTDDVAIAISGRWCPTGGAPSDGVPAHPLSADSARSQVASAITANWEHVTAVLDRRTHLSPNDWFPKHGVEV